MGTTYPQSQTRGRTMTDWEPPRTVAHRETSLAFAVSLVDDFTGDRPDGQVRIALESVDATPVRNPSGFHVFLDLDVDAVTLTVDGGDRYVDERRRVVLGDGDDEEADDGSVETHVVTDPADPVTIRLTPTPAYAFPHSTTLVRGHVRDADGEPIEGATVTLREFDPAVETTDTGEFALWVPVTSELVTRRDGRNVVVVDGTDESANGGLLADGRGTDPTLEVRHPDHGETAEPVEVDAGARTVRYVTLE